jgi:hypothetical protein
MFADLRQRNAITYQIDNKEKKVSVDRWISYITDMPMRQDIRKDNLQSYFESIVYDDYAYRHAEAIGVTKDKKFLLDRSNYLKNVIWTIYEREELKKGIIVTDEDILHEYEQTKGDYIQATDAVITAFSFPDRRSTAMGMMHIRNDNIDSIRGENVIERHRSIKYNDDLFTDSIRAVIFSMKLNEVSVPIYNKGPYLLVIKEAESGSRTRELQEVKSSIMKKIEDRSLEERKRSMLDSLKKQYPIKSEINYVKYHMESR